MFGWDSPLSGSSHGFQDSKVCSGLFQPMVLWWSIHFRRDFQKKTKLPSSRTSSVRIDSWSSAHVETWMFGGTRPVLGWYYYSDYPSNFANEWSYNIPLVCVFPSYNVPLCVFPYISFCTNCNKPMCHWDIFLVRALILFARAKRPPKKNQWRPQRSAKSMLFDSSWSQSPRSGRRPWRKSGCAGGGGWKFWARYVIPNPCM